jgi:hypothetical protein
MGEGLESWGLELRRGNSRGWIIGDTWEEETVLTIGGQGEEVITERLRSIGLIFMKSIAGKGDDVMGKVGLREGCFGEGVCGRHEGASIRSGLSLSSK